MNVIKFAFYCFLCLALYILPCMVLCAERMEYFTYALVRTKLTTENKKNIDRRFNIDAKQTSNIPNTAKGAKSINNHKPITSSAQELDIRSARSLPKNHLSKFVGLKFDDANLRTGPGSNYPIKFHFNCKWYPLEVMAEFEHWRLVRDIYNNRAWIRATMITTLNRGAIVVENVSKYSANPVVDHNGQYIKNASSAIKDISNKKIDRKNKRRKIPTTHSIKIDNEVLIKQRYTQEGKEIVLLSLPNETAMGIARIEIGSVVRLLKCRKGDFCKIATNEGHIGWLKRTNLWGIYDNEKL